MCFYIHNKDSAVKKVAEEDIVCYKAVRRRLPFVFSPAIHMDFLYVRWRRTKHVPLVVMNRTVGLSYLGEINEGYHSVSNRRSAVNWSSYGYGAHLIATCVIPKGADYYKEGNDYVSSSLIIKSVKRRRRW